MPRELLYTAADLGVDGLRGCLCYAGASSNALSNNILLQNLLPTNNYQELYKANSPNEKSNPIGFSHYRINSGAKDVSVISRIGPAPLYANRTNFIAHHIIIDDQEKCQAGPGWLMNQCNFILNWNPTLARISPNNIAQGNIQPKLCSNWQSQCGDAGWAGWLAERGQAGKVTVILYPNTVNPKLLIQEATALLPEHQRWNITFSTYYTLGGRGPNCLWRFIPLDADAVAAPFYDKTFHDGVLNLLSKSLGKAPVGALVNLARGETPKDIVSTTGFNPTSAHSLLPGFDPIKSDLPGLIPTKDPLFSKSELFIDSGPNFNGFDNLKPSGPDNTWKTIRFVGGIFGLLFLLVLPSLFVWLISTQMQNKMVSIKKKEHEAKIAEVEDSNKKQKIENATAKKANDKAESDLQLKQMEKETKEKELKALENWLKENQPKELKNLEELKTEFAAKDKKTLLVKVPKNIIEDYRKEELKANNIINPQGEIKDLNAFVKENKNKILANGRVLVDYLVTNENKKVEGFEKEMGMDKVKKYLQVKDWLDTAKGKLDLKHLEFLKILQSDHKIIEGDKPNNNTIQRPLELMIIFDLLVLEYPDNLELYNQFEGGLFSLAESIANEKRFYLDESNLSDFIKSNKGALNALFNFDLNKNNVNLPTVKSPVSDDDWSRFSKKFQEYLKAKEYKKDPDPTKDLPLIFKHLRDFTEEKINAFKAEKK